MNTDLVLVPFDASVAEMVDAAAAADAGGFDAVWTYDHFSGLVNGARWSRDPWVVLGAIAARTERINVGVLVANAANRHPAQLASAINSLQSLAPGRVILGVGAGTSASSQWSSESVAIDRPVPPAAVRRAVLGDTIAALRALWAGTAFDGDHLAVDASMAVTDGAAIPPIIVGASSAGTVAVACDLADGVNLMAGDDLADHVRSVREATAAGFEVSVFDELDPEHPLGGDPEALIALGVDRRTLWLAPPYPLDVIASIGVALV